MSSILSPSSIGDVTASAEEHTIPEVDSCQIELKILPSDDEEISNEKMIPEIITEPSHIIKPENQFDENSNNRNINTNVVVNLNSNLTTRTSIAPRPEMINISNSMQRDNLISYNNLKANQNTAFYSSSSCSSSTQPALINKSRREELQIFYEKIFNVQN